ncbi:MAG: hypothetical protein J6Z29_05110, partial [Ruminococcus sp.]|nr:hypothetical protein [Ruminococcus sp.]
EYFKRPERTLNAFFSVDGTFTQEILNEVMRTDRSTKMVLYSAAKMQTKTFKDLMLKRNDFNNMLKMNEALRAVIPDESLGDVELKNIIKEKTANAVASCYKDSDKIKAYINGDIAFDEVWSIVKSTKLGYDAPAKCDYIESFGDDDFIMRCIAVLGGSI